MSEDTESPSEKEKAKGSRSRPPTPKGSPQTSRQSPQTLKRSRVTASLEALPAGTVLTDQNGQSWKLGALQTKDAQGILYEAEPSPSTQKYRFSLKLTPRMDACSTSSTSSSGPPSLCK